MKEIRCCVYKRVNINEKQIGLYIFRTTMQITKRTFGTI